MGGERTNVTVLPPTSMENLFVLGVPPTPYGDVLYRHAKIVLAHHKDF